MNPLNTEADPVLVVDDHEDTRTLLVELLELDGFAVRSASSGEEALAIVREVRPCLVVLDLGLPDVNGIELVLRLRSEPNTAGVPIYAVSGYSHLSMAALAAGIDGFLVKPVSPAHLRALIGAHCAPPPPPDDVITQVGPPPT